MWHSIHSSGCRIATVLLLSTFALLQKAVYAIPAQLPLEDVTFVIENVTLPDSNNVPLPEKYTATFLKTNYDNGKTDISIQVFNTMMITMELKEISVLGMNAHFEVVVHTVRTTLMMPMRDVYDVEVALGRILPTVDTMIVGLRGTGSRVVTLQGNGTVILKHEA